MLVEQILSAMNGTAISDLVYLDSKMGSLLMYNWMCNPMVPRLEMSLRQGSVLT